MFDEVRHSAGFPVPDAIRRIVDDEDRKLAWAFFVFFARLEYSLKRTRYLTGSNARPQPDWDSFARDHDSHFRTNQTHGLSESVEYFRRTPPRKQIRTDQGITWSEPLHHKTSIPELEWLLTCVRRVRNNLFHGGKFPMIPIAEPSRDRSLLHHSLTILNASLELDSEVRMHFYAYLDEA